MVYYYPFIISVVYLIIYILGGVILYFPPVPEAYPALNLLCVRYGGAQRSLWLR